MFKSVMAFSGSLKQRNNRTEKPKVESHEEVYERKSEAKTRHVIRDEEIFHSHQEQGKQSDRKDKHAKQPEKPT